MTNQHPLTDEICDQIQDSVHPCDPENMRTAADWQLEQMMEWLDEHLSNYSDAPWLGSCESILDLEDHLKKAMRPQEDS
jgi:hypothetical protein